MNRTICSLVLTFCALGLLALVATAQSLGEKTRYPNELPKLRLYQQAKWRSIIPYVSTRGDVEKILGEPARVYDERFYVKKFNDYVVGYDYDGEWIIIVTYVDKASSMPPSLVGRVFDITLYPRQRVSLEGVNIPSVFSRYSYKEGDTEFTVFGDKCGLAYVIYSKVSATEVHHPGDLKLIRYAVSDQDENRLTHSEESKAREAGAIRNWRTICMPP